MTSNRSMPPATVIPELRYPDVVAATDWLCRAFGFRVRLRIGTHRAQLVVGDGAVVVHELDAGAGAAGLSGAAGPAGPAGHSVMVRVDDVDAHLARAAAAGATILHPPADHPYGERQYVAQDPGGHRWTFTQSIADVDPASWGATDIDIG